MNLLDAEELLHLALHASAAGEVHACIGYLREVLQQQPDHPYAMYFLAVQHGALGLTQRAIGGIEAALAIEPGLSGKARQMARLQLGLLLLFEAGRAAEAREQLASLIDGNDPALRSYAEALMVLADGDSQGAATKLRSALSEHSSANPALSALMQRLLERLDQGQTGVADRDGTTADPSVYLGAYGRGL
jgi:tetratricopeptide (TPR) repeat protein